MGTPEFAVGVLQRIVESGFDVAAVITAPDKPAGRGRKTSPSAVKIYAENKEIPVLQPINLKDETFIERLESFKANLFIVVAFRMLPKVVWQLPEYGTFNLHASLLPQYRGAAPINWAIINGEEKSGVTTFFIDEKIDTGAVILKKEIPIAPKETASTLHDKLMTVGADLVVETIQLISSDSVKPEIQPESALLKDAPKLTPENTRINWNLAGNEIEQFIRGLSAYPAAWSILNNDQDELRIKIFMASFIPVSHELEIGAVETNKKEMKVAVRGGFIMLEEVQFPGKRRMDTTSLLNGTRVEKVAYFV